MATASDWVELVAKVGKRFFLAILFSMVAVFFILPVAALSFILSASVVLLNTIIKALTAGRMTSEILFYVGDLTYTIGLILMEWMKHNFVYVATGADSFKFTPDFADIDF